MWELDHQESWALKNLCFWIVVLEKTLESPLDCKEIQPFNPKGNKSWIFIERTDAEAETPIFWPLDVKNWLIGKDPDAEKDWRQEKTRMREDEMVGWHHWLNGHEFEHSLGVCDGQGSLVCCSPWGCKELDKTEQLNWTELSRCTSDKEPIYQCRRHKVVGSIPESRRSPGGGHSNPLSILASRIPWTEESGGLQSRGFQRVGHD